MLETTSVQPIARCVIQKRLRRSLGSTCRFSHVGGLGTSNGHDAVALVLSRGEFELQLALVLLEHPVAIRLVLKDDERLATRQLAQPLERIRVWRLRQQPKFQVVHSVLVEAQPHQVAHEREGRHLKRHAAVEPAQHHRVVRCGPLALIGLQLHRRLEVEHAHQVQDHDHEVAIPVQERESIDAAARAILGLVRVDGRAFEVGEPRSTPPVLYGKLLATKVAVLRKRPYWLKVQRYAVAGVTAASEAFRRRVRCRLLRKRGERAATLIAHFGALHNVDMQGPLHH